MPRYEYGSNKRAKDHGLLVKINKSIIADCKRNDISKDDFAKEIGTTPGTLKNKLTMTNTTNDFTLAEYIHILEITGDYSSLKYICEMFGFIMQSTEPQTAAGNETLNELTDEMQIECGESFAVVKQALKDKVVSSDEKSSMIKELNDNIEASMKLRQAIEFIKPIDEES